MPESDQAATALRTAILAIKNKHVSAAPDLGETGGQRYVSYFETDLGEQLVFVRVAGEDQGTLYMGDADWEPIPVKRHTEADLEARLRADLPTPDGDEKDRDGVLRMIRQHSNAFAPGVILSRLEIRWLALSWEASFQTESEDRDLQRLGRDFADKFWDDAYLKWPTSKEYLNHRATWMLMFGRFTVEEGLTEPQVFEVLQAAHERQDEIEEEKKR